jgi:hypothetical protein
MKRTWGTDHRSRSRDDDRPARRARLTRREGPELELPHFGGRAERSTGGDGPGDGEAPSRGEAWTWFGDWTWFGEWCGGLVDALGSVGDLPLDF